MFLSDIYQFLKVKIHNHENTKFKKNLPKQVQETTKKAKEMAILTRLCEDIIEKDNKMLSFRIPTRIYTLYLKYK